MYYYVNEILFIMDIIYSSTSIQSQEKPMNFIMMMSIINLPN